MRGDQIEVFNIKNCMDKVDVERMLPLLGHSRTRGHRIRGGKFKTELRRNYFSQRVVNLWSSLPQSAVDVGTVSKFEELDRFLIGNGLKGYGEKAGKWG